MALSSHARRLLQVGLGNRAAADDLADVIDAGSGTIHNHTVECLKSGMANSKAALQMEVIANAGTGMTGIVQRHLSNMVGDAGVAREIAAELA